MNDFKKLSPFKLAKLTPDEKMSYYYKLKDYMIENELYGKNLAFKKLLHPLQILIIKILRIACGDKLIVYHMVNQLINYSPVKCF